jgi:hypothetical protein
MNRRNRNKAFLDKPKSKTDQIHPHPDGDGGCTQEHGMPGDMRVHGEIFIEPTPKEALARTASEKQEKTARKKKIFLDWATLIVVTIYAGLTAWQGCSNQKAASAAKDSVNALMDGQSAQVIIAFDFEKLAKDGETSASIENLGPGLAKDVRYAFWTDPSLPIHCSSSEFAWPDFSSTDKSLSAAEKFCLSQPVTHTYEGWALKQGESKEVGPFSNKLSPDNAEMQARRPDADLFTACYKDIFNRPHFSGLCIYWSNKFKTYIQCPDASQQPCGKQ